MTTISHLECSRCARRFETGRVWNRCACGGPLLVRYDLIQCRHNWSREWLGNNPATMWRYAPVLPVRQPSSIVTLGEGFTPIVEGRRIREKLGCKRLSFKDEGLNPTGSAKARGLSCAVSMAFELGVQHVTAGSVGNAASAIAAYSAAAGIQAHLFVSRDIPQANYLECRVFGASVTMVDGLVTETRRLAAEQAARHGWFDISAFNEPYRVEGKKTIGYEIAEQYHWSLPGVIVCPAGEGVTLIGIWKAFEEMEALGWISAKRPRMIAVQAAGCQPIVRAMEGAGAEDAGPGRCHTVAKGLRVPAPAGASLVADIVGASGGAAVAVEDREMMNAGQELAEIEGMFVAPEAGACLAAVHKLLASDVLRPDDDILIIASGSGLKYQEAYSARYPRVAGGEQDKLGGLITPR